MKTRKTSKHCTNNVINNHNVNASKVKKKEELIIAMIEVIAQNQKVQKMDHMHVIYVV
jgi:hypothetical protein